MLLGLPRAGSAHAGGAGAFTSSLGGGQDGALCRALSPMEPDPSLDPSICTCALLNDLYSTRELLGL